eukprot:5813915-Pleurochrysis_carterae.AAC.1
MFCSWMLHWQRQVPCAYAQRIDVNIRSVLCPSSLAPHSDPKKIIKVSFWASSVLHGCVYICSLRLRLHLFFTAASSS